MTTTDYNHRAELYLGTDWENARAQGARTFQTAANAIRFALEEAAPVSLRGALLRIGDQAFSGSDIKSLYISKAYPLARKRQSRRRAV